MHFSRRKPQQRKHKTWDGDCFITHRDKKLTFVTENGKMYVTFACILCSHQTFFVCRMGTTTWNGVPLGPGYQTNVSGKQIVIESQVSYSQIPHIVGSLPDDGPVNEEYDPEGPSLNDDDLSIMETSRSVMTEKRLTDENTESVAGRTNKKYVNLTSFYGAEKPKSKGKGPLQVSYCLGLAMKFIDATFRHNPEAEGAIVMKAPTKEHQKKFNPK